MEAGTQTPQQRLARRGEEIAADFLERQGAVVLSRNWRTREGELDIVATDGRSLVVCEVKTRSGTGFGRPAESVTWHKRAQIRRLTAQWLSTYRVGWVPIRFDVIGVLIPPGEPVRIEHFPGAF